MSAHVSTTLRCDAGAVPDRHWTCSAELVLRGKPREARAAAEDEGWSREGALDLCHEHTCPYTFGHTKHWCGYPYCRES